MVDNRLVANNDKEAASFLAVAHVIKQLGIVFIFRTLQYDRFGQTHDVGTRRIGSQQTIEFLAESILPDVELHRLVVAAGQGSEVAEVVTYEGLHYLVGIRLVADELFYVQALHLTAALHIICVRRSHPGADAEEQDAPITPATRMSHKGSKGIT